MPLRWKVCGITRLQDGIAAVQAGADAVGFVFWSGSPRAVAIETAAHISAALPAETWRFGVFVNASVEEMVDTVAVVGLDFIQLAGDEDPASCAALPRHAFKVLRPRSGATEAELHAQADRYPECTLLVDAATGYGGTGDRADWAAAAVLSRRHRLMLAGGLNADNLTEAVRAVRPWAVDVASGVEAAPGIKDHDKLRTFGRAVREFR